MHGETVKFRSWSVSSRLGCMYVFKELFFIKHAWNFLGISPGCIIHFVHNKESATERKSRAATVCARTVVK